MSDTVTVDRAGAIARVTLNRPERLNAIDNAMWDRLGGIFEDLDSDETLRCVIIEGAGEKAFSVGADISEFEANRSSIDKARHYGRRTHAAMVLFCELPQRWIQTMVRAQRGQSKIALRRVVELPALCPARSSL